jgi:hypothetical protein
MRSLTRLAAALVASLVFVAGACSDGPAQSDDATSSLAGVVDPAAVEGLWHLSLAESRGRWVTGNARGEFTVTISDGVVVADGICNQLVAQIIFDSDRVSVTNGGVTEAGCPR